MSVELQPRRADLVLVAVFALAGGIASAGLLRERLWVVAALVSAALFASAGGLALFWRHRGFVAARGLHRAAEALRDSERFLDSVIEHSPHAMWISDSHGTLIRLNQACRDLLRITDDEVVGKYNVLEDDIVAEQGHLDLVRRVFEHGEPARFTIEYASARLDLPLDRHVAVVLDVTMSAVRGGDGRVAHAIVQHVDITARVREEEALAVRKRIAETFLALPDDRMYYEVLKVILDVMDSRFGAFGYLDEAGALVVPSMTRDVWDQCQVAEKAITFPRETWGDSSWPRAIREGTPNYSNEVSTRTPDGHVSLRRHISLPILLQGEVIGLFQVANKETDYTEEDVRRLATIADYVAPILSARLSRERADRALRQSERKFRETIRALDEGYYSVTPEGVLLDHNPAFNLILGVDPDRDLRGELTPDAWLSAEAREGYLRELADRGFVRNYATEVETADGGTAVILLNAHLVNDAADRVVRIDGTVTDYTARHRAEEEARRLNSELEQRVVERTERLVDANKELEAFAYSVSHDLRAPLRHIDGYAELLLNRFHAELNEQGRHYLDSVVDSVRQMGRLIDDLLLLSRAGRAEIHESEVDTTRMVRGALVTLGPELADRQIEWVMGELPAVRGDGALLQLVWTNLLANAVKYTRPRAQARIEVGWREAQGESVFFVRDNGVGFDMRYAHKLFGAFQRLHSVSEFEGTGIGLATVRRIVARHGGRTWAEGVLGQGAAFYFSLPRPGGEE